LRGGGGHKLVTSYQGRDSHYLQKSLVRGKGAILRSIRKSQGKENTVRGIKGGGQRVIVVMVKEKTHTRIPLALEKKGPKSRKGEKN